MPDDQPNSVATPPHDLPLDLGVVIMGDLGRSNLARAEAALGLCAHETPARPAWAALHLPDDDAEVRVFSISRHLSELVRGTHQQTAYLDGQLTEVLLTDGFNLAPNVVLKVMNMTPYATAANVCGPGAATFVKTRAAGSLWPHLPPKWATAISKDTYIPSAQGVLSHVLH